MSVVRKGLSKIKAERLQCSMEADVMLVDSMRVATALVTCCVGLPYMYSSVTWVA